MNGLSKYLHGYVVERLVEIGNILTDQMGSFSFW